jgi:hypothetical protein
MAKHKVYIYHCEHGHEVETVDEAIVIEGLQLLCPALIKGRTCARPLLKGQRPGRQKDVIG